MMRRRQAQISARNAASTPAEAAAWARSSAVKPATCWARGDVAVDVIRRIITNYLAGCKGFFAEISGPREAGLPATRTLWISWSIGNTHHYLG